MSHFRSAILSLCVAATAIPARAERNLAAPESAAISGLFAQFSRSKL